MAHEIIERNQGMADVVVVGLQTGGVALAADLAETLGELGEFELTWTRSARSTLPCTGTTSGCARSSPRRPPTCRSTSAGRSWCWSTTCSSPAAPSAALGALTDFGRPRAVQLAVMIDQGHRELPIRPDVGKNLPQRDEMVDVTLDGVDLGEMRKA